jgi:hypothetical protein
VILTPSLDKFLRKTTEKLICNSDDSLSIFERNGNQVNVRSYFHRDICMLEMGIVLLDTWLTISGKTSQGDTGVSKIEINTTSLRYFATILNKLRPAHIPVDKTRFDAEKDKFSYLSTVNFKFMNFGRESLVPGETVLQSLLQPEIRQTLWTLFGKSFYKTLTPAHLAIITDRELILLQDVERIQESKIARYGGVWQYIPLHCLDSVKLSTTPDGRLTLSVHCQPDTTIEKLFERAQQPELQQFRDQLQALLN